ncbi:hypothetical protein CORC01_06474 [Colletotrichum orchidophilum]|uniref:Uncharacterized protein n=1 Tax=Colletotrichum orchidophilum TaxID=1209926 RepID=A0A1G4BA42_9PEZI|nr:uncharacterized protein CORC01_06474 [Colletotrichum orchidophilum]OHE98277.1 hypothetical protein CORC01_06474 [Colletotrichum orchidophilum]
MAEGFYQSLDSTLASHFGQYSTMAATHGHNHNHSQTHLGVDIGIHSPVTPGESDLLASEMSGLSINERSRPRLLPGYQTDRPLTSPRTSSPTGSARSAYTTKRRVSRRSYSNEFHSSSGFSFSSEVSKELTLQAESEFSALMELMASMSRRSTSLREVWSKIITERESVYSEMHRMTERYEELTEVMERKEREHSHHNHEQEGRKQELVKVRLELTAAINNASKFKMELAARENECKTLRHEIAESKDTYTYIKKEHEELKKSSEQTRLILVATQAARADLEDQCGKLRGEREALDVRLTELTSKHEEITTKFESNSKELVDIRKSHLILKEEKHEWLHRRGELEDHIRKCDHKNDELKRKYKEIEELYEKKKYELKEQQEIVIKVKNEKEEAITKIKSEKEEAITRIKNEKEEIIIKIRNEKEELEQHIIRLKRELEEEHCRWEEAEDLCGKWKLKWEHYDREIISLREEISRIEVTRTELRETITKKTEEYRALVIEKKRIQEEGERAVGRANENHRQLLVVQETLSHTESLLKKSQEEIHSKTERIERFECDLGDARKQLETLQIEIESHQSVAAVLKLEVETLNGKCGALKAKCHEWEVKYDDAYESITEIEEGSSSFEYEISAMRTMLREAREQKETAITARNTADRERDEAIARFEEKCRAMERLEERMSAQMHEMSSRSGTKTVTSTTRKSSGHRANGSGSFCVDE